MIEVGARRPTWLEGRDSGESGGTRGWRGRSDHVGLVSLRRTLDYKLCKMRTPSGEVRAGELCVIYVLRDPCDGHMNHELVEMTWGRHECGKSGSY